MCVRGSNRQIKEKKKDNTSHLDTSIHINNKFICAALNEKNCGVPWEPCSSEGWMIVALANALEKEL